MEKVILTWEDIERDCKALAEKIPESTDTLIAVTRGGLFIAGFLSQILNIRDIRTISMKSYNDNHIQDEIEIINFPKLHDVNCFNSIIVDDILDTGSTLQTILDYNFRYNFKESKEFMDNIKILVLCDKGISNIKADFIGRVVEKKWIVFPWEI